MYDLYKSFTTILLIDLFVLYLDQLREIEICTLHNSEIRSKYLRAFSGNSSKVRTLLRLLSNLVALQRLVYNVLIDLSLLGTQ